MIGKYEDETFIYQMHVVKNLVLHRFCVSQDNKHNYRLEVNLEYAKNGIFSLIYHYTRQPKLS